MPAIRQSYARLLGAFAVALLRASSLPAQESTPDAGWFHVLWRDARDPTPMRSEHYALIDDAGTWWDLDLDPSVARRRGGALALNRMRVRLSARLASPASLGERPNRLRVSAMHAEGSERNMPSALGVDASPAASGARAYVTILCAFADSPTALPASKARLEEVMGSSYPGIDHYYREMSEGQVDLSGSIVVGWYTLPQPRSHYVLSGGANLNALSQDCTAAADADVDFPSFAGINLQFNQRLDCCSWGGSRTLTRDGVTRTYPMTWMADWAVSHSVYAHEIGHSFGWPHSHGAYGKDYDSKWDVMSHANNYRDPTFGWVGVHTIAFHKDRAGWIPPGRKFIASPNGSSTILLERGAMPGGNGNYLMAQIAIPGTSTYYTVEARRFIGSYDLRLPGEAVVIHRTGGFEAEVVDVDLNSDPNDAGAQWLPGETFVDTAARIAVAVEAQDENAFRLTITTGLEVVDRPTLALSVGATGRRDSVMARSRSLHRDSVVLSFTGTGATSVPWTAVSHSRWLTLVNPSGTGSGQLRWTRDAGHLAAGTYLDTITVVAAGVVGSPAILIDTLRVLPLPTVEAAVEELLGSARLTSFEKQHLDHDGNRDAVYNLGDFLAFLDRSGLNLSPELQARILGMRRKEE